MRLAFRRVLPRQFDFLSFREILLLIKAEDDKDHEAWRRTAVTCTYIYNWGRLHAPGFRPVQPRELFPYLYGRGQAIDPEARLRAAEKQEAKFIAQIKKKELRLAREQASKIK